jgi:uncharacterized integral membrane protein (TIGR00698 family)
VSSGQQTNFLFSPNFRKLVFLFFLLFCFTPFCNPAIALLLGILVANTSGHPYAAKNHKVTQKLLQISVIGLGFGINFQQAIDVGIEGLWFTVLTIICALVFGGFLTLVMKTDKTIGFLISCATAICGGSAIAAIAPVVRADEKQTGVALGTVFVLNAVGLLFFPLIGHAFGLTQKQFGLWSAIAIHDTSSVVGAAARYGREALQVATTVKLTRALWIIPLTLVSAMIYRNRSGRIKWPYFIAFFVVAMLLSSYVPAVALIGPHIVTAARMLLTATLFLIGAGINRKIIQTIGPGPFAQGILLWLFLATTTLIGVLNFT